MKLKVRDFEKLGSEIERLIARSGAEGVSVALHDCGSGGELLLDADRPFHPCSTVKVCVMMELFRRAHVGDLSLDSMLSIKNSFASFADGEPFSLNEKDDAETTLYHRIGEGETLREINRLMIVRSSNLATNMLLEVLGAAQITSFMHEIGATGLEVRRGPEDDRAFTLGMNNVATARGLMHIFRLLAEGRVVSPEASAEMVEVLLGQEFIEGIPAGLPSGSRVAHKTGWINRHYHDVGIVFLSDRAPWVLAILTKGLDEATDGPRLVAAISRLVEGST